MTQTTAFNELLDIIKKLRDPEGGCPWDLKQTHETLKPYLLEEAYEVLEAIDFERGSLAEELGDVLLQVVLHAQIGSDEGTFTIEDVIKTLNEKLIRRHPHIFSDTEAASAEEVKKNWDQIKKEEKGKEPSFQDSLPKQTTSLGLSQAIGEKTHKLGFDWSSPQEVILKVQEELDELKDALSQESKQEIEEELGDLLFTVAQLTRWCGFQGEPTLAYANQKFIRRFTKLEALASKPLSELSFEELHELWDQIKVQSEK